MRSASSCALALAGLLAGTACAQASGQIHIVVQSLPLAGFRYYAAKELAPKMRVGDRLQLAREAHNAHDANAVSVYWNGRKLGYVPRRENAALAWALDRGEPLHARISRLSSHPHPARRLEFEIYLQ